MALHSITQKVNHYPKLALFVWNHTLEGRERRLLHDRRRGHCMVYLMGMIAPTGVQFFHCVWSRGTELYRSPDEQIARQWAIDNGYVIDTPCTMPRRESYYQERED